MPIPCELTEISLEEPTSFSFDNVISFDLIIILPPFPMFLEILTIFAPLVIV